ncbi:glutathione S-transferase family protein [Kushneria marisflavi]|uniref:Glutathione S-transferase n=1 Tax=Kushneria marisflavi TaxID=157779 RepID=A0A240UQR6_9GAMM|nr:glutathione S-transferase family protein [Kushneria marisflavi]ART63455.1 glutathione S-transferase [Kushneria marisflavi]RKD84516.1 glutathione S-transferase [Kushneria marisflavi]
MYRVYGDQHSGNCYKVRLVLQYLSLPYEWIEMSILNGDTRTPAFLQRNPNGRIPVLELEDGTCLAESNAILCFLADGSTLIPTGRLARARMFQWLFFEQYSHEPSVASARFIVRYLNTPAERRQDLADRQQEGHAALAVMEQQLVTADFLTGERFTLADIALYAYTHVAPEGGIDLSGYPAINAWLARVASQKGHVAMAS